MHARTLYGFASALACALALASSPVDAQSVTCKDGTTSAHAGRGACSHHGGVAAAPAPRTRATAPAPATTPRYTPPSPPITYQPRQKPARPAPAPSTSSAPNGATAQCRDGTYSYSAHRRGTCSHHGGVATWF